MNAGHVDMTAEQTPEDETSYEDMTLWTPVFDAPEPPSTAADSETGWEWI